MINPSPLNRSKSTAPYGYMWQEGNLVVDEKEAPVRSLIYDLFIKERKKKAVARILNEGGYRTRNGSNWSDTTIDRLIKDQTAKGVRIVNYTKTTDNKKAWKLKPESEWITHSCDPIVTEAIWNEANAALSSKRRIKGRPAVQLFSGLTHCHCGGKMYVPSNTPKYRCWSCSNKIPVKDLEALFHNELASFFVDEAEVDQRLLIMDEGIGKKESLLLTLESQLKKLQKEVDKLHELYQSEMIDKYGFGLKYLPMKERLEELNNEIPNLQADIYIAKTSRLSKKEIMSGAKDLHSSWPKLDMKEKRSIVEAVLEEIIIGIDEITITLLQTSSLKDNYKATREQGFIAATS